MSALLHIKNLIINSIQTDNPDLKKAIISVLNNIDTDLDDNGYETSVHTDQAIEYLDEVLCAKSAAEDEDLEKEDEDEEDEDKDDTEQEN